MDLTEELATVLDEVRDQRSLDPLPRLALYVRRAVESRLRHADRRHGWSREAALDGPHKRWVADVVREAQGRGEVPPFVNRHRVAELVGELVEAAADPDVRAGARASDAVAETCAAFILNGLSAPASVRLAAR